VCVEQRPDGPRVVLAGDLLRPHRVANGPDGPRVGLVATTALLLGGDEVDLAVELGPGARLELFDVAGTVAYHGRGRPAAWRTTIALADGACLTYRGQPFVVSDGADVSRTLQLDLADSARLRLRESLVLGRDGQVGGRVHSRSELRVTGVEVWRDDTDLDPAGIRDLPGLLGGHRVVDTVLTVGQPAPFAPPAVTYALLGGAGTVTRWLGHELAASPLHGNQPLFEHRRSAPLPSEE
jgi:urease accessory protein